MSKVELFGKVLKDYANTLDIERNNIQFFSVVNGIGFVSFGREFFIDRNGLIFSELKSGFKIVEARYHNSYMFLSRNGHDLPIHRAVESIEHGGLGAPSVHHINGDKTYNKSYNLVGLTRSQHAKLHSVLGFGDNMIQNIEALPCETEAEMLNWIKRNLF